MKERVYCSLVVDSAPGRLCFGNDVLSCIEMYIHVIRHSFIREIPFEKDAGT